MAKRSVFAGDKFDTNEGYTVTVVEYNSATDVVVEFNDCNKTRISVEVVQLRRGSLGNPNHPKVKGVGFFGIGPHSARATQEKMDSKYDTWTNMLARCYDERVIIKQPTYKGCYVAANWHNYQEFAEWYIHQIGAMCGYQLDKDLLYKDNKEYGPETCILLPPDLNKFPNKRRACRGHLPIGVGVCQDGGFIAQGSFGTYHRKTIGRFKTVEEAFESYKQVKEGHAKFLASLYKDRIDPRAVYALENYKVDWED